MMVRDSKNRCAYCGIALGKANSNPDNLCAKCSRLLSAHRKEMSRPWKNWVALGKIQVIDRCDRCFTAVSLGGLHVMEVGGKAFRACKGCHQEREAKLASLEKAREARWHKNGSKPAEPEQVPLPGVPEGVPESMDLATLKTYANAYIVRYASERAELERRAEAIGFKLVRLGVDE